MAIEKLKKELDEVKNNLVPVDAIGKYLIAACKINSELAEAVKCKDKNLNSCCNYVLEEVKKELKNTSGYIEDQKVYDMACTYYLDKKVNIKLDEEVEATEVKEETTIDKKDKSLLEEKDKEIAALKEKIKNIQESNKQEALNEATKEAKKKQRSKKKSTNIEGQISLF